MTTFAYCFTVMGGKENIQVSAYTRYDEGELMAPPPIKAISSVLLSCSFFSLCSSYTCFPILADTGRGMVPYITKSQRGQERKLYFNNLSTIQYI